MNLFDQEYSNNETNEGLFNECLEFVAGERRICPLDYKREEEFSTRENISGKCSSSVFLQEVTTVGMIVEETFEERRESSPDDEMGCSEDVMFSELEEGRNCGAESEEESCDEIVDAQKLRSMFRTTEEKMKKATNAPKFLYNAFYCKVEEELPINSEYEVHLNWINNYYRRHNDDKTITRFHLCELFGAEQHDHRRIRRSQVRREILQRRLCCERLALILDNKMIPSKNKEHYLYFSKIYEWRLNNADLISRFN